MALIHDNQAIILPGAGGAPGNWQHRFPWPVNQTNHFFNLGYGWLCKHCSAEDAERKHHEHSNLARFFTEGETEEKEPKLSSLALARWTDSTRRSLTCPRCKIEEMVNSG